MSSTFDIYSVKSVPSTYKWDNGNPGVEFTNFLSTSSCVLTSATSDQVQYVGYAPYMVVTLSSTTGDTTSPFIALRRVVNFGDYYNSESNIVTVSNLDDVLFCHTYVMPGTYTITFERTEYDEVRVQQHTSYGNCLQRHCIDWAWKSLTSTNQPLSVTWADAKFLGNYEKKWKFEPCNFDGLINNGLYVQPDQTKKIDAFSWQWYNYTSKPNNSAYNTPTLWLSSGFQQPDQLTWTSTSGPCFNLDQSGQTIWSWKNLTEANGKSTTYNSPLTWNQLREIEPRHVTWDYTVDYCAGASFSPSMSSSTSTITRTAVVKVLENLPVAYIQVFQPADRLSPMKVTLSPRQVISGSFPIEKIVWDLGDGSPLLTRYRWSKNIDYPFVFSGYISDDYQDPRNYDIEYTYTKTKDTEFCFYPSLTAYASSTSSSDCAAAVVGPLKYNSTTGHNVVILQNELTDKGKIMIGQVDNNVAMWRADK